MKQSFRYLKNFLPRPISVLLAAALMAAVSAAALSFPLLYGREAPTPDDDSDGQTSDSAPNVTDEVDDPGEFSPPISDRYISVYFHDTANVKLMGLEDYICGVLSAEMPSTFAVEALKSGAVAARSYAVYRSARSYSAHPSASVCTDPGHCQAYRDPNSLSESARNKVIGAVSATYGQVMSYNGKVIEALYHSSSNGKTLSAAYVFGNDVPYLQSVESPETAVTKTVRLTNSAIAALFSIDGGAVETLASPPSLTLDSAGRVSKVTIAGASVTGSKFKTTFGLLTTDFKITATPDGYSAVSYGFGHGVGMSQYGANAYAEQGKDYKWILEHYYVGAKLLI